MDAEQGPYDAVVVYRPKSEGHVIGHGSAATSRDGSYDIPPHLKHQVSYGDSQNILVIKSKYRWWRFRWLARRWMWREARNARYRGKASESSRRLLGSTGDDWPYDPGA